MKAEVREERWRQKETESWQIVDGKGEAARISEKRVFQQTISDNTCHCHAERHINITEMHNDLQKTQPGVRFGENKKQNEKPKVLKNNDPIHPQRPFQCFRLHMLLECQQGKEQKTVEGTGFILVMEDRGDGGREGRHRNSNWVVCVLQPFMTEKPDT